jgi:hypothetical protein
MGIDLAKYFMRNFINIITENVGRPPLPSAGETPWWIATLAPLTKMMKKKHSYYGWTWVTGGCFAFVEAAHEAYGGEKWGVCSYAVEDECWDVEHAVLKVAGVYYDYNGVFDPAAYIVKLRRKYPRLKKSQIEMLPENGDGVCWMQDDFFDDEGLDTLHRILKTGA